MSAKKNQNNKNANINENRYELVFRCTQRFKFDKFTNKLN